MKGKLFTCALVTAITSSLAYLAGAWTIIYGLRPEHPEIAPIRLFNEALSHLPFLVLAITMCQLVAFACVSHRAGRLPLADVVAISAEASGLVALVHGLISDFTAFDELWWWLILGSTPIVIGSTVALVRFKTEIRAKGNSSLAGEPLL